MSVFTSGPIRDVFSLDPTFCLYPSSCFIDVDSNVTDEQLQAGVQMKTGRRKTSEIV
jgi:hypothetical protein